MFIETRESFNTEYQTWVIAYCIDIDSFFVTNERHFFWHHDKEFSSEKDAIEYFETHVNDFIEKRNEIAKECGGIRISDNIFLEETMHMYSRRCDKTD